jgi:hypothetical protein
MPKPSAAAVDRLAAHAHISPRTRGGAVTQAPPHTETSCNLSRIFNGHPEMMVPNADRAIVAQDKLTGYLLNMSH